MRHKRNNNKPMKINIGIIFVIMFMAITFVLGAAASDLWAWGNHGKVELDEAEIFFEENATDKDLGIQFFLDGDAWERIKIFGPRWNQLLDVKVRGNAKVIGLTELFSESAEPSYVGEDGEPPELTREELLALFPPGTYRIYGRTVEGNWLRGETELTQDIPCASDIDVVAEAGTLTVEWEEVEAVVDPEWNPEDEDDEQVCIRPPADFEIAGYEAVFEMVVDEEGEERVFVNTATLPASATQFSASPKFVDAAAAFRAAGKLLELKVEVIAIEETGNKAITEETLWPVED